MPLISRLEGKVFLQKEHMSKPHLVPFVGIVYFNVYALIYLRMSEGLSWDVYESKICNSFDLKW